jgi:hypothetical protein
MEAISRKATLVFEKIAGDGLKHKPLFFSSIENAAVLLS